jgi:hypothetical protein
MRIFLKLTSPAIYFASIAAADTTFLQLVNIPTTAKEKGARLPEITARLIHFGASPI